MEHQEAIGISILNMIHNRSASGCLVRAQEILTELKGQGLLESVGIELETHLKTMLKQVLEKNQDIQEIFGRKEVSYYYSVRSMTEAYAGILVWKSEDPLWLIAEVVRESSKVYPSPVPVVSFREPPFDLTLETILECFKAFGEGREYQDICQTITSTGTIFLYSSLHLDSDYAAMLAEWIDVGQADNP